MAVCLLAIVGVEIVPWFYNSWVSDPYFSHGSLVMLWGVGLAVYRYTSYLSTSTDSHQQDNANQGLSPMAKWEDFLFPVGGALLFTSMALNVFSLKALGWMLILIGLVRWRVGNERFRIIAMPLYFTLLSIPWPWGVVQMVALPLQETSATLARVFLDLSGLPVLQEGIVLDTGRFKLVVEEICSGLRSFVALLTVAIFLVGAGWGSRRQHWAAPFVVLAIILCGNATRLITALAIGHWFYPEWAMVWVEDVSPFLLILTEAANSTGLA